MAEIWEAEADQLENAIEHYQKASQIYRGEEQQSQANKCDLKAASMLATNKQYEQAVQLFEQVYNILSRFTIGKARASRRPYD